MTSCHAAGSVWMLCRCPAGRCCSTAPAGCQTTFLLQAPQLAEGRLSGQCHSSVSYHHTIASTQRYKSTKCLFCHACNAVGHVLLEACCPAGGTGLRQGNRHSVFSRTGKPGKCKQHPEQDKHLHRHQSVRRHWSAVHCPTFIPGLCKKYLTSPL